MNEAHIRLANDSPSFTPVHPRIRAIGPRDLHLAKGRGQIPAREIDGKRVQHPPEFWEAEQALVPWKEASWGWMVLAFWDVMKTDVPNERVWVKKSWRRLQGLPYPSWQMILDEQSRYSDKQVQIQGLMESL
jgi:hypothetical protein